MKTPNSVSPFVPWNVQAFLEACEAILSASEKQWQMQQSEVASMRSSNPPSWWHAYVAAVVPEYQRDKLDEFLKSYGRTAKPGRHGLHDLLDATIGELQRISLRFRTLEQNPEARGWQWDPNHGIAHVHDRICHHVETHGRRLEYRRKISNYCDWRMATAVAEIVGFDISQSAQSSLATRFKSRPATLEEISRLVGLERSLGGITPHPEYAAAPSAFFRFHDRITIIQAEHVGADHGPRTHDPVVDDDKWWPASRLYGVEIEGFFFVRDELSVQMKAVMDALAASDLPGWTVVEDGSINDALEGDQLVKGLEVVSPPLMGEAGLSEIRRALAILSCWGFRCNSTCGLHVHVEAIDACHDPALLTRLFENYLAARKEIMGVVHKSRSENPYCQVPAKPSAAARSCEEVLESVNPIAEHNPRGKYYELHGRISWLKHNTIEWRMHHGTTNAEDMCSWVRMAVSFVQASFAGSTCPQVRLRPRTSEGSN